MSHWDISIEHPDWEHAELGLLVERAFGACARELKLPAQSEVSLLGCDDARIAVLNAEFRGKPTPTNVLSWPSEERGSPEPGDTPALPDASDPELGDIAIAYETCAREAHEQGKPFDHHVTHLLIHGLLHLLGYDHEREPDWPPHGIPSANPIFEAEDPRRVDAKGCGFIGGG